MRIAVLLFALVVGCSNPTSPTSTAPPKAPDATTTVLPGAPIASEPPVAAPTQARTARCRYRAGGDLPDPMCTPGAYDPTFTVAQACGGQNQTRRNVPTAEKIRIAAAYGVTRAQYQEADHLGPLALGGLNDDRNIWPEPLKAAKDAVEAHVLAAVCQHRMTLLAAQTAFVHDWRTLR